MPAGSLSKLRELSLAFLGRDKAQDDIHGRRAQFTIFAACGTLAEVPFTVANLIHGEYLLAAIVSASTIVLIGSISLVYKFKDPRPVFRVNMLLAWITAVSLVSAGGAHGSRALWMYMCPLVAFFLFDKLEGALWAATAYAAALVIMCFSPSWLTPHDYPGEFIRRFAATYLCVCVVAWWHEFQRHRNALLMDTANLRLTKEHDALRKSEERFRNLFETSRDALMTMASPSWNFTSANSAAIRMFRAKDPADIVSRGPAQLSPPFQPDGRPSDDKAAEMIGTAMREGSTLFEWSHKRLDGEIFPADVLLTRMESYGITFLHATVRDISERKRIEAHLTQAEKLSAVGRLAAGVAHEINNPLGVIMGFAQCMVPKIKNEHDPMALPVGSIMREVMRCKKLVESLLMFSRQSGQVMEKFAIDPVIEIDLSLIRTQARVKSIELYHDLRYNRFICGEKDKIHQILFNLCSNAMDAMPNGGKLSVRTRSEESPAGDCFVLEVEDTGKGIPETIAKKIFEPFFTTKEPGKGTGLGLALVHEIVQKYEGKISVKSEEGKGTTFSISLPAANS